MQQLTDFAPAHTTATGVLPSSVKSADTSMLTWPPLQAAQQHSKQASLLILKPSLKLNEQFPAESNKSANSS
jgi:hypothetical protein